MNTRIEALQKQMRAAGCDLVIIAPSADMRYLCGLNIPADERCELLLVYDEGKPALLLSPLYLAEGEELKADFELLFTGEELKYDEALRRLLPDGAMKVGIDNRMWAVQLLRLQELLPSGCQYFPASELLDAQRAVKDERELAAMRRAGEIAASAWESSIGQLRLGMTERQFAAILETEMRAAGAEALSFETIVAFGKNTARPHHVPGDTALEANQFILTDFGCVYEGYCSDVTRTVCFGRADTRMKEIYNKVLAVKNGVKAALRPGMTAGEVERRARELFGADEPAFIHRISHGLGMYVHEAPHFSPASEEVLKPGMVFSVEPGLYYPGQYGVRIEDAVALTASGLLDMHILPDALLELEVK